MMTATTKEKKEKRTRLSTSPPSLRSASRAKHQARVLCLPFFVVVKYLPSDMMAN